MFICFFLFTMYRCKQNCITFRGVGVHHRSIYTTTNWFWTASPNHIWTICLLSPEGSNSNTLILPIPLQGNVEFEILTIFIKGALLRRKTTRALSLPETLRFGCLYDRDRNKCSFLYLIKRKWWLDTKEAAVPVTWVSLDTWIIYLYEEDTQCLGWK